MRDLWGRWIVFVAGVAIGVSIGIIVIADGADERSRELQVKVDEYRLQYGLCYSARLMNEGYTVWDRNGDGVPDSVYKAWPDYPMSKP